MQRVDSAKSNAGRYARGVKSPSPRLLARIEAELGREPGLSKSELARRLGVSRQTVLYALRAMPAAIAKAAACDDEAKHRLAIDHLALVERVLSSADEVSAEIRRLRAEAASSATSSAVFRGHAVLTGIYRLLGELLGEVAPPTTTVYLTQVQALLAQPIDPATLPSAVVKAMHGEGVGGPAL